MSKAVCVGAVVFAGLGASPALAESPPLSLEERLARLEQAQAQQEQVQKRQEEALRERDARIRELEQKLAALEGERSSSSGEAVAASEAVPAAPAAGAEAVPSAPVAGAQAEPSAPVALAPAVAAAAAPVEPQARAEFTEYWGEYDPGQGFLLGKDDMGEVSLSAYALVRYLDQSDDDDQFVDHLGREREVDGRRDIYSHRLLVWLNGWMGNPKLRYTVAWWTVNTTDQDALFANIGYQFNRRFNLYGGVIGNAGSRSMLGSHPYWLGHDRVMADEFFRPFFTQGAFANGELVPGLWYSANVGNTSSILGTTAVDLDRNFTYGGSLWWMPTTHEFGPRGGYGDWEYHEEVATRFGVSANWSPEQRYDDPSSETSRNSTLKLADSVNLFETGALAPGVTVLGADYNVLSVDAGVKYRGMFLQGEYYFRTLDSFDADGLLPHRKIEDEGFYVQAAFYPIPKKLEAYTATSQIFGDDDAGFDDSSEWILGLNYYPADTRNHRVNLQYINVDRSPVSSTFGYYVGGQKGDTLSLAASIFF